MIDNNIIKKWKPIMEAIGVEDDKTLNFLSEYAEHHANNKMSVFINPKDNTHSEIDPFGEEDWYGTKENNPSDINTLPVALKILSNLNLKNKNCTIEDGLPNVVIKSKITREQIIELNNNVNIDVVQMLENVLIQETIFSINKQLENHNNFRVNSIAQSVSFITDDTFDSYLILKSRFLID